ncbi:hypothetical protein XH89_01015 [Bradyrhizobium sp. CCBAU 53340]|nr:hypothetical protein XH89_01015 [Bradyrhizobium sp. CCBAU 53340]
MKVPDVFSSTQRPTLAEMVVRVPKTKVCDARESFVAGGSMSSLDVQPRFGLVGLDTVDVIRARRKAEVSQGGAGLVQSQPKAR